MIASLSVSGRGPVLLGVLICVCPCTRVSSVPDASSTRARAHGNVWWSTSLGLPSLAAIDEALRKPFEGGAYEVSVGSPAGTARQQASLANCLSYFSLRDRGFEPTTETDFAAMKIDGARCHAIRALRTAKPASRDHLDEFRLDATALESLPPAIGPQVTPADIDTRQDATRKGAAWKTVDPGSSIHPAAPASAKVTGPDWTTELELLARGDFNGDGSDDLLIKSVSYGKEGSWREVRLRLLSRQSHKQVLTVVGEMKL